jgi:hypothetical protein
MRLASIILLSLFSIQAHAIEPGAIAVPSMSVPNMDMPTPLITSPNMDMPETNPKPQAVSDNNPKQNGSVGTIQTQTTEAKSDDVSGKWSIKFNDRTDRSLDLTLWSSSGTKIMGYGTLTEMGTGNSVTATGSFAAKKLILTVKSAEPEHANQRYDEYYLDMFMANNTLSGTYILRSGGEFLGNGNATAAKR